MSDTPYSNRSDLQNVAAKVATGQTYGMAKQQMDAQRAVPMGKSPVDAPVRRGPAPGSLPALTRPTERPNEPITAGADVGAGPTSLQAGIFPAPVESNDVLEQLIYLNRMFPNPDVQNLISALRDGGV
jgi:hypothetical protein